MRRQRNMKQMKEQGKNLQDQINEERLGNLPEKEIRVMIVNTKSWKYNGSTNRENTRNVLQGPRRTEEQTNSDEQHNK